jgi:hypothetical protein
MPTISDLWLRLALDSEGNITANTTYNVTFTAAEKASKVHYAEEAVLYHRQGLLDDWHFSVNPALTPDPSDTIDTVIQLLNTDSTTHADNYVVIFGGNEIDPSDPGAEGPRSFEATLTHWQRQKLLEVGREHAYALVSLRPMHIGAAFKLQQLEIDVGDPPPS